jgi:DNA-binding transcriptional LysR family regulator
MKMTPYLCWTHPNQLHLCKKPHDIQKTFAQSATIHRQIWSGVLMDSFKQMQIFVLVCERGSFSQAAEVLDCSVSRVTRAVEQLETAWQVRLLQRTTRRLSITTVGEQVLIHCRQLLAQHDALIQQLQQPDQIEGLIRMALPSSLLSGVIAPHLAKFRLLHPSIHFELHISDRTIDLLESRIDVALRISPQVADGLIARPIADCKSVLCASPHYLAQHGHPQTLADLLVHACIGHQHVGRDSWPLCIHGVEESVPIRAVIRCDDVNNTLALVQAHAGIAMLPVFLLHDLPDQMQLAPVLMDYSPKTFGVYAVYTSRHYMPRVVQLWIDYLQTQVAADPCWAAPRTFLSEKPYF